MRTLLEIFIENKQGANIHVIKLWKESRPDLFVSLATAIAKVSLMDSADNLVIRANKNARSYMEEQAKKDKNVLINNTFRGIKIIPMEQSK